MFPEVCAVLVQDTWCRFASLHGADNNFTYDCVGTVLPRMDADGKTRNISQEHIDFPFGSAIASTILENLPYQNWFVERFNAAVFENQLKFASKGRKENQKAEEHQMNGIGLESHFSKLKFPLMKAIVDKLAALKLPIKLTETDTGRVSSAETKAFYLEQALRERLLPSCCG
ncbi:hypothetical protein OIU77_029092 [Salix suchowensis]|uniref:Uncharacterized protein n=1 Tax=Salix suchowensis TaxID=1278906 RepID=A0ABQ9BLS6_9ROSI|nr:hypothetical protein OIU77_029092 [Salix suchowensis]